MKSKALFFLILLTFFALLIPVMHAQTYSVIHAFAGGTDGAVPKAGVTIRGNALYGTTTGGGYNGTVYQLTNSGSNWVFSALAGLGSKGSTPLARVIFGPDGHLYGTSIYGGTYSDGTVFKLTPEVGLCRDAACYWTVSVLHDFGLGTDGEFVDANLIWDQQGNIYGTTTLGGTSGYGHGTVFELTPSGNGYTENLLYSFSGGDGESPNGGVIFDNKGNLFGTTYYGGSNGAGNIYELTYAVGTGWTEHVLHDFQNTGDGGGPAGELVFDSAGNLYGTTNYGGNGNAGTVFELSPSGDSWIYTQLYHFSGRQWCGPGATLTMDGGGNLYGTTICDGLYGDGNVFKLSNTRDGWVYTSLYDFTGGSDGANPYSSVTIDGDGTLYGTAGWAGNMDCIVGNGYGCGVVWMIKP